MPKLNNIFSLIALSTLFSGCQKTTTCDKYLEFPDCTVESRSRFYGMYRGVSTLDDGTPVMTQWQATPGQEISQINLANHVTLELDYTNPHYFKVRDSSYFDTHQYIRHEGHGGMFSNDSLYLDFWLDDGITQIPGEKKTHYTFAGKRK